MEKVLQPVGFGEYVLIVLMAWTALTSIAGAFRQRDSFSKWFSLVFGSVLLLALKMWLGERPLYPGVQLAAGAGAVLGCVGHV